VFGHVRRRDGVREEGGRGSSPGQWDYLLVRVGLFLVEMSCRAEPSKMVSVRLFFWVHTYCQSGSTSIPLTACVHVFLNGLICVIAGSLAKKAYTGRRNGYLQANRNVLKKWNFSTHTVTTCGQNMM
jgi:hypothetical protein